MKYNNEVKKKKVIIYNKLYIIKNSFQKLFTIQNKNRNIVKINIKIDIKR